MPCHQTFSFTRPLAHYAGNSFLHAHALSGERTGLLGFCGAGAAESHICSSAFPVPQYAERVWITLLEKGVPHRLVHVDLSRKPAWYGRVNPRGLVPALQHAGRVHTESADICRYLDAAAAGPSLTPAEPGLQQEMEALLRGPCSGVVSSGLDLMSGGPGVGCQARAGLHAWQARPVVAASGRAFPCSKAAANTPGYDTHLPQLTLPSLLPRRRQHCAQLGHWQRADGGAARQL